MKPIHIVDRLTSTYKVLRDSAGLPIDKIYIADLLKEARDTIHDLEGNVYSYPPTGEHNPHGTTWRKEYEDFYDSMIKMAPEEFVAWQTAMKD